MAFRQLIGRISTAHRSLNINSFQLFHKLSNRNSTGNILRSPFNSNFSQIRSATIKPSNTKSKAFFGGVALTGGLIAAYYMTRNTDDFETETFVNPHLKEDLESIKKFGAIPYLLVGGGCASFSAYEEICKKDPKAKVIIIGDEPYLPYMRPPLSKELWLDTTTDTLNTLSFSQQNGKKRSIFFKPPQFYTSITDLLNNDTGGLSILQGAKVVKVNPSNQVVYLNSGEEISYKKCLLATGARPKNLPVFEEADKSVKQHIMVYRNINDFKKLIKAVKSGKSVVIVGGGFLGTELAYGLANNNKKADVKVVQLFPETGNIAKVLPEYLSAWTSNVLKKEGIKVIPNATVTKVSSESNQVVLKLSNNETLKADFVVVAVGADPNTDIAKTSGLEVDTKFGGFLVNTEMEARKNLWVAGDASCFYDVDLGRRRVEHHDHAVVSGHLAGGNMVGDPKAYWHQSMFWSDVGKNLSFEAIGLVDSSLQTLGVFAKSKDSKSDETVTRNEFTSPNSSDDYSKGVVFYLRDNVIVGILLWNVFGKMDIARKIMNEQKTSDDVQDVAKLFDLKS